jgi:hypothetical protein
VNFDLISAGRYYTERELRLYFDFEPKELRESRRDGSLRFTTAGGGRVYLGAWVLAWLHGDAVDAPRAG